MNDECEVGIDGRILASDCNVIQYHKDVALDLGCHHPTFCHFLKSDQALQKITPRILILFV